LTDGDLPLATLWIEKLNLRVPVFEGTDEWNLNRGVGWIAGTTWPGKAGNVGIAGHRDGYFRGLKDLSEGDLIELFAPTGTTRYVVDEIEIVDPDNVGVLRARKAPSLTLVTCYPFNFIGSAPQRFVLHAAETPKNVSQDRHSLALAQLEQFDNKEK
jgi:sortase A